MPRMLGVTAPPGLIDDVIVPPEAHGVRLISMGFFAREDQAVIWRGPMLHKALEQFLTDVYWGELDYLVVDMPPGTGDVSLSIAQFLPRAEVIVVTTPQPAAQRVAQRAAAMAEKVDLAGDRRRSRTCRGSPATTASATSCSARGGGEELAGELGVPLLGADPAGARRSARAATSVVRSSSTEPDGEVARGVPHARRAARHRARAEADLQPRAEDQLSSAKRFEQLEAQRVVGAVRRVEREARRHGPPLAQLLRDGRRRRRPRRTCGRCRRR